jgi:hypothetical protein
MDLMTAGIKRKIQIAELEKWRKMLTTVPSYIKKELKDGTTNESRPINLSQEIKYFSLTLVFVYSIMISFIVSGKTLT